jgi:hypothetical protein
MNATIQQPPAQPRSITGLSQATVMFGFGPTEPIEGILIVKSNSAEIGL